MMVALGEKIRKRVVDSTRMAATHDAPK